MPHRPLRYGGRYGTGSGFRGVGEDDGVQDGQLEIMGAEAFRLCALRKNLELMLGPGAFASSQDASCVSFRPRESGGRLGGHCTAPGE